jgi:phosphoribosylamine--glycine ligase
MRILVVGSGGREHALCWAIAASPLCDKLYCAPGNAGIAEEAECIPIAAENVERLVAFAAEQAIDFVVVGPEAPLVLGLVDRLAEAGIKAFGPSGAAAALEGSKGFMKDLAAAHDIPTAAYARFDQAELAKAYVAGRDLPIVIKADGLAAGKGVVIAETFAEAMAAIDNMMSERQFGAAGAEVVIEELLVGEELSFFALVDGERALPLASAQDHKRVGDGDTGPNTGGMGAYSPAPAANAVIEAQIMGSIIQPAVAAMAAQGTPFKGVLFAGIMLTEAGPKLLEFNVRFGDPECQVLCLRLKSDLLPALLAAADGALDRFDLRWRSEAALTVVMAAKGYPGAYARGSEIRGLAGAAEVEDVTIFHAATRRADDGRLLADGGRVLGVSALGATVAEARERAYRAVDLIDWPEGFCRRDIGWRAIRREASRE